MLNVLFQQNILSLPMHDMLSLQYLEVPRLRLSILVAMGKLTAASYSDKKKCMTPNAKYIAQLKLMCNNLQTLLAKLNRLHSTF